MTTACDLHVHSTFSTYDGMGSPKAVVARAVEMGWGAAALTEHGWLGSAPVLYQEAKKAGIKPIIGCEMYVTPEEDLRDGDKTVLKERRHLTVLALSFEGYQNLVTWVNASMERPLYYSGPRISLERMVELAPWPLHHNVILSGCMGGELCQCLMHTNGNSEFAASSLIDAMSVVFPNFYIEIQNHTLGKYMDRGLSAYEEMVTSQAVVRGRLLELASTLDVPVIVTNDSHYQSQDQRNAHMAMLARKQYKQTGDAHRRNVERGVVSEFAQNYAYFMSYMRPMEKIAATLPSWAEKQALNSIHEIVEEANVVLDPLDNFSYSVPRSGQDDPVAEIRRRSKSRLKSVIQRHGEGALKRFEYELGAMSDFADYLVLVSDVVRMARSAGIYTWTRGSAANSLVAYCMKIHDIDPIHYKLMFERFVNPERMKLPDIDLDIEGYRRDDLARMVKEHMAEIEGDDNVRGICTFSTVNNRSAFRMMAEAAGVPEERIDELAKILPQIIDSGLVESDEEAYEILKDEFPDLYELVSEVFDAIGGVSQHACAYVIGTKERPLSTWVPNYRIGSSDAVVTQYNMKAIEELGFLKLDLLKLDTLSIMHSVARMLGRDITWLDEIMASEVGIYDAEDEETFTLLREGRTEGIHSMQGATQRRGCIEVGVETDDDLVAIQALYRPSGTRTGLDKAFVNRKHGREDWASVNKLAARFLDETYGIAIYQEQIMEMGAAMGMTGAEIDDLYKAIKTAKGAGRGARELFEAFEPTFRKYADEQMSQREADELWAEWEKLQGYCVVGETVVEKGDGSTITVKDLFDIWHGPITPLRKKWRSNHPRKGLYLTSWRDNGVFLDKCIDIIDNGDKDVWTITLADGKSITATANHPILTSEGWIVVGHLDEGDEVVIDTYEIAPYKDQRTDWSGLETVTQTLIRVCANCGSTEGRLERAHLNHDRTDNRPENVKMLCNSCHKKHDYATGRRKGRWSRGRLAGLSKVLSIAYAGRQRTFDLVMQGDEHNFVANGIVAHNTFNRGHATSYAILALKTAWIKAHYPQEFFVALLDRYPDNPRYLAAAIDEGFRFEAPDVNASGGSFAKGSDDKAIRIGLSKIKGVGPGAVSEITRNQPFSSVEDLRERTNSNRVKQPTIDALSAVGALDSLGIDGEDDDLTDFELMKFIPRKPKAFKGCKPQFKRDRGGKWEFTGLERGVTVAQGKSFCAKLFWLPPVSDNFTMKTSATGKVNAHLLTVVDENGIPFDLIVPDIERKESEIKLVKLLAKKARGTVICAEGQVSMPFLRGGNTGFKLWGIAGAEQENPNIWGADEELAKMVIYLASEKRRHR